MNKLDLLLDEVQNTRFQNKYHDFIKNLAKSTQFGEMELSCILMVYNKFLLADDKKADGMSKNRLSQLFQLWYIHDNQIMNSIISKHVSARGEITANDWVNFMSIVMCDDLEVKMKYVYEIYDIEDRGFLGREIVSGFVSRMFLSQRYDEDEIVELVIDMVETIFAKFDLDKDGYITFEEYKYIVRKSPMLLEFLGQVFPTDEVRNVYAYCSNLLSKVTH